MTTRASLFVFLAFLAVAPLGAADVRAVPDIALTDSTGSALHLADYQGKVVLVDFWASWCVPCRKSFPHVDALNRELRDKGLVVLAVNLDEKRKSADAFLQQFPHSMTVAYDPEGTAADAFGLKAMPTTMIVDRSGHIRYTHMGYTERTIGLYRAEVMTLLGETR